MAAVNRAITPPSHLPRSGGEGEKPGHFEQSQSKPERELMQEADSRKIPNDFAPFLIRDI
jgi:hypothetical protein